MLTSVCYHINFSSIKYSSVTATVLLLTTVITKHECKIKISYATHATSMKCCVSAKLSCVLVDDYSILQIVFAFETVVHNNC